MLFLSRCGERFRCTVGTREASGKQIDFMGECGFASGVTGIPPFNMRVSGGSNFSWRVGWDESS